MYSIPANKNYLEAQTLIGLDYFNGEGIAQDYRKAFEWFQKAADQDYAHAQYLMALMYRYGEGIDQDSNKAFEWFQKSANQGYADAQYSIALMYEHGLGTPQDFDKAFEWLQKSAKQGFFKAQAYMEDIHRDEIEKSLSSFEAKQKIDLPPKNIEVSETKTTTEFFKKAGAFSLKMGKSMLSQAQESKEFKEEIQSMNDKHLIKIYKAWGTPSHKKRIAGLELLNRGYSKDEI